MDWDWEIVCLYFSRASRVYKVSVSLYVVWIIQSIVSVNEFSGSRRCIDIWTNFRHDKYVRTLSVVCVKYCSVGIPSP